MQEKILLDEVYEKLLEVFGCVQKAADWYVYSGNPGFDGATPQEVCHGGGEQEVLDILEGMLNGVR